MLTNKPNTLIVFALSRNETASLLSGSCWQKKRNTFTASVCKLCIKIIFKHKFLYTLAYARNTTVSNRYKICSLWSEMNINKTNRIKISSGLYTLLLNTSRLRLDRMPNVFRFSCPTACWDSMQFAFHHYYHLARGFFSFVCTHLSSMYRFLPFPFSDITIIESFYKYRYTHTHWQTDG